LPKRSLSGVSLHFKSYISYLNTPTCRQHMGFIQNWMDRRRRKELEHINREIEELKRRGPDYVPHDHKTVTTQKASSGNKLLWIIFFVFVIGIVVFYQMKLGSLKEQQTTQQQDYDALQIKLDDVVALLNQTEKQLQDKQKKETTLTSQYSDLQGEILDLSKGLTKANAQIMQLEDELNATQEALDKQKELYKELENCVDNNTITDKDDCI